MKEVGCNEMLRGGGGGGSIELPAFYENFTRDWSL